MGLRLEKSESGATENKGVTGHGERDLLVHDDHVGCAGHAKSGLCAGRSGSGNCRDQWKDKVICECDLNLSGASGLVGGGCGIARVRRARDVGGTNRARNPTGQYRKLAGIDARWRDALHIGLNVRHRGRSRNTRGGIGCCAAAVISTV